MNDTPESLAADLDAAARRAASMLPAMAGSGELLVVGARGRAPIRTGRLRRSIRYDARATDLEVVATAPYAAAVDAREPFMSPTEKELQRVDEIIAGYIVAPLTGEG